jgi:hypothetical protein
MYSAPDLLNHMDRTVFISAIHWDIPQNSPALNKQLIHLPSILAKIDLPPVSISAPPDATFEDLPCSEEDVQKIARLISYMGENGKIKLLLNQKELRQIGREINHVHPLKFIMVIINDPYLKICLKQIRNDYFKWVNLMDGLGNGLSSSNKQGKVEAYLNDFAAAIHVSPVSLQDFVKNGDWENMIIFLMNN